MHLPSVDTLKNIYGEEKKSIERFRKLGDCFKEHFGTEEIEFFSAPGRTEIIGNHTDHNGGKILAASIDMDTVGAAYPNNTSVIHIVSEGYKNEIIVDLKEISKAPKCQGTVSLVAGMMEAAEKFGFQTGGFSAYVSTNVIGAAGVSSSASFEMLICCIINYFFNQGKMEEIDYARIGQYAENVYWEKASGLMDQMACAVGGTILLDFSRPREELYSKVDFSFGQMGYDLVIVNTGKGHADLSEEYSSIPMEMKEAAAVMGADILGERSLKEFMPHIKEMDNDRSVLRALHFFQENKRVEQAMDAIDKGDKKELLHILEASGNSSWKWLQNCYAVSDCKDQKVSLTLALTEIFLETIQDGCCRVHGGGFAGVIMAVVPKGRTEEYVGYISQYVGEDNVYPMNIRQCGALHLE
ncbi:MAG: galactokinase family protein [Eubacteriales bacterium]|nr:galactokinase family protein [Eubacteriales bacterium]